MIIHILTLFPQMFSGPFDESIVHRAQEKGLVKIKIHNLRNWAVDKRGTVDDRPFGGGPGMVLKPEPIFEAVADVAAPLCGAHPSKKEAAQSAAATNIILLTPQGQVFNQKTARRLSKLNQLIFICGHYEGVDERIREHLVDEEISIGDYILTGGELPAMVVTDAIVRLIPGVLEKPKATESESFSQRTINNEQKTVSTLEPPQYTRPENFRGLKIPKILLSGHHQEIEKWRKERAEKRTRERRPDLFQQKTEFRKRKAELEN